MKITPRQRTFLRRLSELCGTHRSPVHYSVLAAELGVSKFSAYDMLRVLEEKGLAEAEYVLDQPNGGPGRSMVMFRPTAAGLRGLSGRDYCDEGHDWEGSRQRLLDILHHARELDSGEVIRDILGRLPNTASPLVYCGQVVTALLMNLDGVFRRASDTGRVSLTALASLIPSGDVGLSTLIGLSVGSSLGARHDSLAVDDFLTPTRRLQAYLQSLSEDSKRILAEFLRDAIAAVEQA